MPGRLLAMVLAMLALVSGVVIAPAPALARCNGDSCNFADPQASGCGNAGTTTRQDLLYEGYLLELRRSTGCNAIWARLQSDGYHSTTGQAWIEVRNTGIRLYTRMLVANQPDTAWSGMYSASWWVRACYWVETRYPRGTQTDTFCTGWH